MSCISPSFEPTASSEQALFRNIANGAYTKTIFDEHLDEVCAFAVQGHLAATASEDGSLRLWDLSAKQCRWVFCPEPRVQWQRKIHIAASKVICSSFRQILSDKERGVTEEGSIRVVDLENGKEVACITDDLLNPRSVCYVGQRIFAELRDGNLQEWDLTGRKVRKIDSENLFCTYWTSLKASEDFLVKIKDATVITHDLKGGAYKKQYVRFADPILSAIPPNMSCFAIAENQLLYGVNKCQDFYTSAPDFYIFDLNNAEIVGEYHAKGAFLHTEINYDTYDSYETDSGAVTSIFRHRGLVYIGHSTGRVVAVDLLQNKHTVLGEHRGGGVFQLAVEGNLLVSRSGSVGPTHIKIWNIDTFTEIAEHEEKSGDGLYFKDGKLITAVKNTLVVFDYLSCPKDGRHECSCL